MIFKSRKLISNSLSNGYLCFPPVEETLFEVDNIFLFDSGVAVILISNIDIFQ